MKLAWHCGQRYGRGRSRARSLRELARVEGPSKHSTASAEQQGARQHGETNRARRLASLLLPAGRALQRMCSLQLGERPVGRQRVCLGMRSCRAGWPTL